MSSDPISIGLSDEQADQVMQLRNEYQTQLGYKFSDPAIWFGNHLSNYVSMLCLEAAIENHRLKTRRTTQLRRDTMLAFESYLERKPTPDDLINELSRFVAVPGFLANTIRRDVQRLLAC